MHPACDTWRRTTRSVRSAIRVQWPKSDRRWPAVRPGPQSSRHPMQRCLSRWMTCNSSSITTGNISINRTQRKVLRTRRRNGSKLFAGELGRDVSLCVVVISNFGCGYIRTQTIHLLVTLRECERKKCVCNPIVVPILDPQRFPEIHAVFGVYGSSRLRGWDGTFHAQIPRQNVQHADEGKHPTARSIHTV